MMSATIKTRDLIITVNIRILPHTITNLTTTIISRVST